MPSQTNPLFLLYAVVIAQFVQLIVLLTRRETGSRSRRPWLLMLAVMLTLIVIEFALTWSGYLRSVPWLMGMSYAVPFLIGPLLYGYLREEGEKLALRDFVHLLPFVWAMVTQLGFFGLSAATKLEVYEEEIVTEAYFHEWGYIRGIFLKALHLAVYVWWMRAWEKDEPGRGLWGASAVFALLWAIHGGLLWMGWPGYALTYSVQMVLMGGLAVWLHWKLSVRRVAPTGNQPVVPTANGEPETRRPKYRKSGLAEKDIDEIAARVSRYMEEERPFLHASLRLADLANGAGVPPHHLTEVLNQHFGQKFTDYVNGYRVAEAKQLLTDAQNDPTMLAVAYAAGFNSKNSFNRAFRKFTGLSPTEYKKEGASGGMGR